MRKRLTNHQHPNVPSDSQEYDPPFDLNTNPLDDLSLTIEMIRESLPRLAPVFRAAQLSAAEASSLEDEAGGADDGNTNQIERLDRLVRTLTVCVCQI
jgi:hypothetical protein